MPCFDRTSSFQSGKGRAHGAVQGASLGAMSLGWVPSWPPGPTLAQTPLLLISTTACSPLSPSQPGHHCKWLPPVSSSLLSLGSSCLSLGAQQADHECALVSGRCSLEWWGGADRLVIGAQVQTWGQAQDDCFLWTRRAGPVPQGRPVSPLLLECLLI